MGDCIKFNTIGLMLTLALSVTAMAQSRPNFTGHWKLDVLRSRMDPKSDVKNETMKIEHADPKLKIDMDAATDHGPRKYVLDLTTDGTPSEQTIDNQPCKTVANWGTRTGERLMLETTCSAGGTTVLRTREMKLGSKGKMLTTVMTVKDERGQRKSYEFFMKQ